MPQLLHCCLFVYSNTLFIVYCLLCLLLQAKTASQWAESGEKVEKSPPCLGGGGQ